ncbi:LysR family transcriptional regulator [Kribbella pittospori]|uniref:LysR family transcriptional regulator n=1 Tax=Kribbella pittospori TaxID=722689 RepID=A0A4V2MBJ7_9ACTN|nr:LysR family transcriptional regulator [Kribbella pittospori]TCC63422.1 LysR family transcriptional regulator [Kribbella pittospori]
MELRQLVYFDAVVRHGGFTRAAENLRIAQPAISAQIRRLETELGTELLQRSTRRVSLTHAGELFWSRTRRVLDELDAGRADLDQLAAVLRGRVRIGATEVLGTLQLPAQLADFRRRYPGLGLTLRSGLIDVLLEALDGGELDVVIGPVHADLSPRYVVRRLVEESVVLVTPPGRRLDEPSLAAARDESFICLPVGSGLHEILTRASADAGFIPRIEFETYSPASIRELVSAGLGVALLAGSAARAPGPPIEVHPLPHLNHPPIGLMTLGERPLTPAAAAFRDFLTGRGVAEEPLGRPSPDQR